MKIKKLNILNIQSLRGDTSIDFEAAPLGGAGIFAITGPTGAGKTTLLDGITLALYGVVHRQKPDDEIISYGAGEASAEILVENRGRLILSKWSRARARKKPEGNLQPPKREVSVWNKDKEEFEIVADKINDANAQIAELTGLDFPRFTRSVLLAQGDFAAFLSAGPKERKDLLERITGTEIYTSISKAAHIRAREASEQLKALNQELEHVGLKNTKELTEIQEELKAQEKLLPDLQKNIKAQQKILEQYTQLEKAKQQAQEFVQGFDVQKLAWSNFQPQIELLNNYRKVFPLKAQWEQRGTLLQENEVLDKNRQDALKEQNELHAVIETQSAEVQAAQQALDENKAELPGIDDKIKQAIQLEEQLLGKTKSLKQERDDFGHIKQKETKLLGQIDHAQKQIKAWQEKQLDWSIWEKEHPEIVELEQDFPTIQSSIEKIIFLIEEGKKTKQQIAGEQEKITAREKQATQLRTTLSEQQAALAQANKKLVSILPAASAGQKPSGSAELRQQYLSAIEQKANLLRYEQLVSDQAKFEKQELALQAQLKKAQKALKQNNTALQEAETNTTKTAKALSHADDIYRQQLLVKNYERERANLKEDAPCPLCGAIHHPETHGLKSYVDESLKSLEAANANHETARTQQQQAALTLEKIKQQIESLDEKSTQPNLRTDLAKRMAEHADIIQSIELALGMSASDKNSANLITQKIEQLDQSIRGQESKMAALDQLEQQRSSAEQTCQKTQSSLDNLLFEHKQLTSVVEEKAKRKKGYTADYLKNEKTLSAILKKYKVTFDFNKPKEVVKALYHQTEKYKAFLQHQKEHDTETAVAKSNIKMFTKEQGERMQEMKALSEKINILSAEQKKMEADKKALVGDQSPSSYKANLLEKIKAQETGLKEKEKAHSANKEKVTVLKAREKDLSQRIQQAGKKIKSLDAHLEKELTALGLVSGANFGNYFLEDAKVQLIESQRDQIKEGLVRAEQNHQRQQKELKQLAGKLQALPSHPEVAEKASELLAQEQQLQERMGALKQILQDEEKKGAQVAALREKITAAQAEDNRWEELRLLIGSAEGHKFSEFAQSITLNQLIALANEHLQKLSGRYIIEQHAEKPLSLNIIDTYQADNTRSMGSLSGGESFLVSLSLALGLSDLAGNRTQIQSLFIDEGFGSLDEQSLNLAIETLENLQSSGKTIGVISHVKELQERIATQIRVVAGSDGFGHVELS